MQAKDQPPLIRADHKSSFINHLIIHHTFSQTSAIITIMMTKEIKIIYKVIYILILAPFTFKQ
jgi:hypothetical protein